MSLRMDLELNKSLFQARADIAMLLRMLDIAGFPDKSEAFADLRRRAVEEMRAEAIRDWMSYLAHAPEKELASFRSMMADKIEHLEVKTDDQ